MDNINFPSLDAAIQSIECWTQHYRTAPRTALWYGFETYIRLQAGLPNFVPIMNRVDHAPITEGMIEGYVDSFDLKGPYPQLFFSKEKLNRVILKQGRRGLMRPRKVTNPYLFYRHYKKIEMAATASGVVFFPKHTTFSGVGGSDATWDTVAQSAKKLEESFDRVTVCMFWKDFSVSAHLPFIDRGLSVVTAGHMFDPNFIPRLYGIIRDHEYSCGNAFATHALISLEMGLPYFHWGPVSDVKNSVNDYPYPMVNFDQPRDAHITGEIREKLVNRFMSQEDAASQNELRAAILIAIVIFPFYFLRNYWRKLQWKRAQARK